MEIKSFTQLNVWKKAHSLVLDTYNIVDSFPKKEEYILTPQILRSAISVTSNIAEGFSRNSKKEKIQFYYISMGSLTELQNQLLIARDVGYMQSKRFNELSLKSVEIHKMLNKLISSIKNR